MEEIKKEKQEENFKMELEQQTNLVYLDGTIITPMQYAHDAYAEKFYQSEIIVPRLSGQDDILPITFPEKLISGNNFAVGSRISFLGQFRSYNQQVTETKSKLILTVFVKELVKPVFAKSPNSIVLSGFLCKPANYRTTPFNREIADVLIAVNRSFGKSDYIPCIAWGRNARFVQTLEVGEKIALTGRIQSREYQKHTDDGDVRTLTAYEVSIARVVAYEKVDSFNPEYELGVRFSDDARRPLKDQDSA